MDLLLNFIFDKDYADNCYSTNIVGKGEYFYYLFSKTLNSLLCCDPIQTVKYLMFYSINDNINIFINFLNYFTKIFPNTERYLIFL